MWHADCGMRPLAHPCTSMGHPPSSSFCTAPASPSTPGQQSHYAPPVVAAAGRCQARCRHPLGCGCSSVGGAPAGGGASCCWWRRWDDGGGGTRCAAWRLYCSAVLCTTSLWFQQPCPPPACRRQWRSPPSTAAAAAAAASNDATSAAVPSWGACTARNGTPTCSLCPNGHSAGDGYVQPCWRLCDCTRGAACTLASEAPAAASWPRRHAGAPAAPGFPSTRCSWPAGLTQPQPLQQQPAWVSGSTGVCASSGGDARPAGIFAAASARSNSACHARQQSGGCCCCWQAAPRL